MAELEHRATRRTDHRRKALGAEVSLPTPEYAIAMQVPPRAETLRRHYARMTLVPQRHDGSAYFFVDVLAVDVRMATQCALFCWGIKMCYLGRRP